MVRVLRGIVFVVLVLGPAGRLRAQGAPSGSPFDYALFGLTQTRLGPGVEVFSGDIGANVGTYALRALRLGRHAELVCAAACRIAVLDPVRLGARAQLSPAPGLADTALEVDVAAGGSAPAFRTGPGAAVTGIVYAPAGGLVLGGRGRYEGSVVGATVRVGADAQVLGASSS